MNKDMDEMRKKDNEYPGKNFPGRAKSSKPGGVAFFIGGQWAWSPIGERRSKESGENGVGKLLFNWGAERVMLWINLKKSFLKFVFTLSIKCTFM